jgi:urease beta subunit
MAALIALAAPSGAQASTAGLSPSTVDFPDTLLGVSSPDQQVFFTNDGPDPVDVGGVSIGGQDPSDFTVTVDNCTGVTLAASESCELRVGFAPTARGALSAELEVSHTGEGSLATAALSGKGLVRELAVSPGQLDFPATTVNYQGGQQQVEVKNTGDLPVQVNNVFIDGSEGADFNQNNNCGGKLDPEQVCYVNVAFWPHGEGSRNATLHVSSDASRPDETVPLSGTGAPPQLSFEPGSYDFGLQQINNNSTQTTFQLRNTGAAPVQVNSIDFVAPGPSAFWTGFVSCWGMTLQPNDTCTVEVNFGPNQPIAYSAQLRASVNGVSFTADLSGRGGQPVFTASPNPADFGSATPGKPGVTRTITLTNEGDLPGGFFIAIISGGDVDSFRLSHEDCTGAQLDPSASCTAQVRFQPDSAGRKRAQLTLVGGEGEPFQINLTGTGVAKGNIGVRFQWRRALRVHGKSVVVGRATCRGADNCRLSAHAVVGAPQLGTKSRLQRVKLPGLRLRLGADQTRALRLRLPGSARRLARKGGRLRLELVWSAGGQHGRSSYERRLRY